METTVIECVMEVHRHDGMVLRYEEHETVVRCRHCLHKRVGQDLLPYCRRTHLKVRDDGFCAWGCEMVNGGEAARRFANSETT